MGFHVNVSHVILDFQFKPKMCDGSHHLTMKAMSFSEVNIVLACRKSYKMQFLV